MMLFKFLSNFNDVLIRLCLVPGTSLLRVFAEFRLESVRQCVQMSYQNRLFLYGSVIFVVRLKTILLPCIGHNSNFHLRVSEHSMLFISITLLT